VLFPNFLSVIGLSHFFLQLSPAYVPLIPGDLLVPQDYFSSHSSILREPFFFLDRDSSPNRHLLCLEPLPYTFSLPRTRCSLLSLVVPLFFFFFSDLGCPLRSLKFFTVSLLIDAASFILDYSSLLRYPCFFFLLLASGRISSLPGRLLRIFFFFLHFFLHPTAFPTSTKILRFTPPWCLYRSFVFFFFTITPLLLLFVTNIVDFV